MSKYIPKYGESTDLPAFPVLEGIEFRHVPEWPGYAVSSDGEVWTCRRCGIKRPDAKPYYGRWLKRKPAPDTYGYRLVGLANGTGKFTPRLVCKLMLVSFVGPRPDGLQCRHLDGNNKNDRIGNLVWGTIFENAQDRVKHGTCFLLNKGLAHPAAKISDEQVAEIIRLRAKGVPRAKLAAKYGITKSYITQLCYWGGRDARRRKEDKNGSACGR